MGDEVELPELPESEREIRRDKLNTAVALSVTLLVTFMAICKITDNNIVLLMQQAQAAKGDKWTWYQALNVRLDLNQSKLSDLKDDEETEDNPARKKNLVSKMGDYEKLETKLRDKKDKVKEEADAEEKHYDELHEVHEKFDHTEGAVSIAVSLFAMTSLLQKRWMFVIALIPSAIGVWLGIRGLLGVNGNRHNIRYSHSDNMHIHHRLFAEFLTEEFPHGGADKFGDLVILGPWALRFQRPLRFLRLRFRAIPYRPFHPSSREWRWQARPGAGCFYPPPR